MHLLGKIARSRFDRLQSWLSARGSGVLRLGAAHWIAWLAVLLPCLWVLSPLFESLETYGFHDWDAMTSHRELVVASLRQGEFPGWNKFACGGFPAWGYAEGGTNLVSPLLPVYLLADIRLALRLEVAFFALLGAVGAYTCAGRFVASPGARAFAAVLWATNGRFALQAASGHTWHLGYALLPWCLYFFERARKRPHRRRHVMGLSLCLAWLVYAGGLYPLPHTVLLLALYALGLTISLRSVRPLLTLAGSGIVSLLVAAPKLLPLFATFARAPRLIASEEKLSLDAFVTLLVSREQGFFDRPAAVTPYGWHEWGMYVSFVGAMLMLFALLVARGRRERVLRIAALLFIVLGFGAFSNLAPWSLLHQYAPLFRSQHVPSRFLYTAAFLAALLLASLLGHWVRRVREHGRVLQILLSLSALGMGLDVASVAVAPMREAFWMLAPRKLAAAPRFHHERRSPVAYLTPDWAAPMFLAMRANTGVLECYGAPPFEPRGALSPRDRHYLGEAFIDDGNEVRISEETLQTASFSFEAANEAALLVYNMNFDAGFEAEAIVGNKRQRAQVVEAQGRVAIVLPEGATSARLSYWPQQLSLGIGLSLLGLVLLGAWPRLRGYIRR